jgi:hypothetical protein
MSEKPSKEEWIATLKLQNKAIVEYRRLLQAGRWCKLELANNGAEITIYDATSLHSETPTMRALGIHKLEKGEYTDVKRQYANGYTKDYRLRLHIVPLRTETGTFEGCHYEEVQVEKVIPAQEAREAIPEHTGIVTEKKLVCH